MVGEFEIASPLMGHSESQFSASDSLNDDLLPLNTSSNSIVSLVSSSGLATPAQQQQQGNASSLRVPPQHVEHSSGGSARPSFDSVRRSFDFMSSQRPSLDYYSNYNYGNGNGNDMQLKSPGKTPHSGSLEYSPLGNNSVYEVVMNTRRKNWLPRPTVEDIPPVKLTSDKTTKAFHTDRQWLRDIEAYVSLIKEEFAQYTVLQSTDGKSFSTINITKNGEEQRGSIDEIPAVFHEKVFKLDNQRVFNKICDFDFLQYENVLSNLKTQLAGYLKTVEDELLGEISLRSEEFFTVLQELDSIKKDIVSMNGNLDELQMQLSVLQKNKISNKTEEINNRIKLNNVTRLNNKLVEIKNLIQEIDLLKSRYHREDVDYSECLKEIQKIEGEYFQENKRYQTIKGLKEYVDLLVNLKIEIGGKLSLQFIDFLLKDLDDFNSKHDITEVLNILQNESKWGNFKLETESSNFLNTKIKELNSCDELIESYKLYQEKIIHKLKVLVKSEIPQVPEHDNTTATSGTNTSGTNTSATANNSNTKLSTLIRSQTPLEFIQMLNKVFCDSVTIFKRSYEQQKILLDMGLKEVMSNSSSSNSNSGSNIFVQLDIRNGINESVRIVQLRMAKIITVRKDINNFLPFEFFLKLHNILKNFIKQCEVLTGENLTRNLNEVIVSQSVQYVKFLNQRLNKNLNKIYDMEKWEPRIVPIRFQQEINNIVSCGDINPLDWYKYGDLLYCEDSVSPTSPSLKTPMTPTSPTSPTTTSHKKSVVVGDKTFVSSESLYQILNEIKNVLILSINLPPKYLNDLEKTIISMLNNYNSYHLSLISIVNTLTGERSFKESNKNYSILSESLECLKEIIPNIERFYIRLRTTTTTTTASSTIHSNPNISMSSSSSSSSSSSTTTTSSSFASKYKSIISNYNETSTMIYTCNMPPPMD